MSEDLPATPARSRRPSASYSLFPSTPSTPNVSREGESSDALSKRSDLTASSSPCQTPDRRRPQSRQQAGFTTPLARSRGNAVNTNNNNQEFDSLLRTPVSKTTSHAPNTQLKSPWWSCLSPLHPANDEEAGQSGSATATGSNNSNGFSINLFLASPTTPRVPKGSVAESPFSMRMSDVPSSSLALLSPARPQGTPGFSLFSEDFTINDKYSQPVLLNSPAPPSSLASLMASPPPASSSSSSSTSLLSVPSSPVSSSVAVAAPSSSLVASASSSASSAAPSTSSTSTSAMRSLTILRPRTRKDGSSASAAPTFSVSRAVTTPSTGAPISSLATLASSSESDLTAAQRASRRGFVQRLDFSSDKALNKLPGRIVSKHSQLAEDDTSASQHAGQMLPPSASPSPPSSSLPHPSMAAFFSSSSSSMALKKLRESSASAMILMTNTNCNSSASTQLKRSVPPPAPLRAVHSLSSSASTPALSPPPASLASPRSPPASRSRTPTHSPTFSFSPPQSPRPSSRNRRSGSSAALLKQALRSRDNTNSPSPFAGVSAPSPDILIMRRAQRQQMVEAANAAANPLRSPPLLPSHASLLNPTSSAQSLHALSKRLAPAGGKAHGTGSVLPHRLLPRDGLDLVSESEEEDDDDDEEAPAPASSSTVFQAPAPMTTSHSHNFEDEEAEGDGDMEIEVEGEQEDDDPPPHPTLAPPPAPTVSVTTRHTRSSRHKSSRKSATSSAISNRRSARSRTPRVPVVDTVDSDSEDSLPPSVPASVPSASSSSGGGAVVVSSTPVSASRAESEKSDQDVDDKSDNEAVPSRRSAANSAASNAASTPQPHSHSTAQSASTSASGGKPLAPDNRTHKGCNCKKSKCLKLYCECFARQGYCVDCNCVGCNNVPLPAYKEIRQKAIQSTLERDAHAFFRASQASNVTAAAQEATDSTGASKRKGCHCKKSECLKKYCECYQAGMACTDACKCLDCRNGREHSHGGRKKSSKAKPPKATKTKQPAQQDSSEFPAMMVMTPWDYSGAVPPLPSAFVMPTPTHISPTPITAVPMHSSGGGAVAPSSSSSSSAAPASSGGAPIKPLARTPVASRSPQTPPLVDENYDYSQESTTDKIGDKRAVRKRKQSPKLLEASGSASASSPLDDDKNTNKRLRTPSTRLRNRPLLVS